MCSRRPWSKWHQACTPVGCLPQSDIDTDMLTPDEARARLAARPLPDNPWIEVTEQAILIHAGYTETIEHLLRWVPKTRWSARHRCWIVPLTGLEMVRTALPEISRLAEAMHGAPPSVADDPAQPLTEATARRLFRDNARLLFGSDWQRETARALGRDEAALAQWLIGEAVLEAPYPTLLVEMHALMVRRAAAITSAAEQLEARVNPQ